MSAMLCLRTPPMLPPPLAPLFVVAAVKKGASSPLGSRPQPLDSRRAAGEVVGDALPSAPRACALMQRSALCVAESLASLAVSGGIVKLYSMSFASSAMRPLFKAFRTTCHRRSASTVLYLPCIEASSKFRDWNSTAAVPAGVHRASGVRPASRRARRWTPSGTPSW